MIIFGRNSKELPPIPIQGSCPNCQHHNTLAIHTFQEYIHVFWVPIFPINRIALSHCSFCKQTLEPKEMPASLLTTTNTIKDRQEANNKVWTYVGMAVAVYFIVSLFYKVDKEGKRDRDFIASPSVGDIYSVKTKRNQFTLLKINAIKHDLIYVQAHKYEVNKQRGLTHLLENYDSWDDSRVVSLSKQRVKEMYDEGEIVDVTRDE